VIVSAALAPGSSRQVLERVSAWLDRNDGDVIIVLGLVFGGWLLAKGLSGLGAL
jgi:hypothetical protein